MFKSQQYRAKAAEYGVKGSPVWDESRKFLKIAAASAHRRKHDANCDKPSQVTHRDAGSSASALSRWDNEGGTVRDEPSM